MEIKKFPTRIKSMVGETVVLLDEYFNDPLNPTQTEMKLLEFETNTKIHSLEYFDKENDSGYIGKVEWSPDNGLKIIKTTLIWLF